MAGQGERRGKGVTVWGSGKERKKKKEREKSKVWGESCMLAKHIYVTRSFDSTHFQEENFFDFTCCHFLLIPVYSFSPCSLMYAFSLSSIYSFLLSSSFLSSIILSSPMLSPSYLCLPFLSFSYLHLITV